MFGSNILDVAIGVVFVYILLSFLCTAINEGIATLLNKRGRNLFEGVTNLLNDPQFTGLAQQLYTHGLVCGISRNAANPQKPNRLPSYMASNTFALALLDLFGSQGVGESWPEVVQHRKAALDTAKAHCAADPNDSGLQQRVADAQAAYDDAQARLGQAALASKAHAEAEGAARQVTGPRDFRNLQLASAKLEEALALGRTLAMAHPDPLGNFRKAVERLPDGHTKEALLVLVEKTRREAACLEGQAAAAGRTLEQFQANLEHWFNETMDRVSGWYKRWTQKVLLIIALALVLAANADTLMLAKRFTRDTALRAAVVTVAERTAQSADASQGRQTLLTEAEKLTLPLGWIPNAADPYKSDQVPESVPGWLLKGIGLLISVGAVSLGAPFWFDTLSRFVNLRGAGTPPGERKTGAPMARG